METQKIEIDLPSEVESYLETALWSTLDYYTGDDDYNPPLDENYSIDDISDAFKLEAIEDYNKLMGLITPLLTEDELNEANIGHDFWLTRNGHGAGFWDGDYENGYAITEIVNKHFNQNDDELNEAITRE